MPSTPSTAASARAPLSISSSNASITLIRPTTIRLMPAKIASASSVMSG